MPASAACLRLLVARQGYCGLENLALIPGTVGAAPIQNIGAYGVEVCDCIHAVEAYQRATGELRRLDRDACRFAYRDSLFKQDPERFLVTAVEFALSRSPRCAWTMPDPRDLQRAHQPGARDFADSVIRRAAQLPDRTDLHAAVFSRNPLVPAAFAGRWQDRHPVRRRFAAATRRRASCGGVAMSVRLKGHATAMPASPTSTTCAGQPRRFRGAHCSPRPAHLRWCNYVSASPGA